MYIKLNHGTIYCSVCADYVYDEELDAIRATYRRKQINHFGLSQADVYNYQPKEIDIPYLYMVKKRYIYSIIARECELLIKVGCD